MPNLRDFEELTSAFAMYKGDKSVNENKRKSEAKIESSAKKIKKSKPAENAVGKKETSPKKNNLQLTSTKIQCTKAAYENGDSNEDEANMKLCDQRKSLKKKTSKSAENAVGKKETSSKKNNPQLTSKIQCPKATYHNGNLSEDEVSEQLCDQKKNLKKGSSKKLSTKNIVERDKSTNMPKNDALNDEVNQEKIIRKYSQYKVSDNTQAVHARSKNCLVENDKFNNLKTDDELEENSMEFFKPANKRKRSLRNNDNVATHSLKIPKPTRGGPRKSVVRKVTKSLIMEDSVQCGKEAFSKLINPIEISVFFKEHWEQRPLVVHRNAPQYFASLLSTACIDKILRKEKLYFSKNVDVTLYSPDDQLRQTFNAPSRATAPLVWSYYDEGCSIRILNPQTFLPVIHAFNARLQEYFACFVGANIYLTPGGRQGFAPHYDDIEAFVLQIEGEKLWKLYAPRHSDEILPRVSSDNLREEDLGPPIYEVLLKAGDTLYFPRGFIHQAFATRTSHSLHITVSVYQKNSWADFMEILLPAALRVAIESDIAFRKGLPLHYLSHLGVVHSDKHSNKREYFIKKFKNLMKKLEDYAPIDAAVDQLGKQFMHSALPPHFRTHEKAITMLGDGEHIKNGNIFNRAEFGLETSVKLVRYNCLRIVTEEDSIRIYYSVNNSLEYHGEEPQYLETDEVNIGAIEALISAYPKYITIEEIPIEDVDAKIQIARDLWELGLLFTKEPLGDVRNMAK